MFLKNVLFSIFASSIILGCESKPKVIVADETPTNNSSMQVTTPNNANATSGNKPGMIGAADVHQVIANEILQTDRYTYLNVTEAGKKFWIATSKTDAVKGQTYLYRGGLMKTNFESIEFKRTFDTIYLVSNIIDASAHPGGNISGAMPSSVTSEKSASSAPIHVKDAVKLSDLMTKKAKYDGQIITIAGECVKVNNGIMGRNWVHIHDGSQQNGKAIDLTVTTNQNIPIGSKVALKGKIALNKDFGAGYRYDIIMEDAISL